MYEHKYEYESKYEYMYKYDCKYETRRLAVTWFELEKDLYTYTGKYERGVKV